MPKGVLILILVSSGLHVYWNLLIKKSHERLCFLWWMYLVSFLLLPVVIIFVKSATVFTFKIWLIVCLSASVHFLYTLTLSAAYDKGDLSLVYPLARSAPLFVMLGGVIVLKEIPSVTGFVGIILTVGGAYIIGLKSMRIKEIVKPIVLLTNRAYQLALFTAIITAAYSIIDRIGVSLIDPFAFIVLLLCLEALLFTPFVLWKRSNVIIAEWRENNKNIILAGLARFVSYLLILYVMLDTQLSYVVAVRQISIVLAVITGSMILKEENARTRMIGALGILAGVIVIGAN